jgi:polyisoprenoid-binding protein YceI
MRIAMCAMLAGLGFGLFSAANAQDAAPPPAGIYQLDPAHARLIFQVSHLGFSNYTAFFKEFDAKLVFDPNAPETMTVTASVNPASIETHYPDPALDFNATIAGPEFLDAAAYPAITFTSTSVTLTGEKTADVGGDLTLHGVTLPITLSVTFNGGYAGHPLDAGARIGFSAKSSLMRSAFGIGYGIPAPGTTMGVGDQVSIIIEAEFLNPDAPKVTE